MIPVFPAGGLQEGRIPLPADPPIGGPLWTVAVPILLFLVALAATILLYRRFSGDGGGDEGGTEAVAEDAVGGDTVNAGARYPPR